MLQDIIQMVFRECIAQIRVEGTEVVPVPLYNVLDSTDPQDYENRVEPSVQGSFKMGQFFASVVEPAKDAPAAQLEDITM